VKFLGNGNEVSEMTQFHRGYMQKISKARNLYIGSHFAASITSGRLQASQDGSVRT
jgi:hypothetical protein